MDDIDPDSLRQYRTEFRLENSTHLWNRVDDKTFLPRPFKLEKGGKRNDDTPQHEALREAFTNSIIHCDLMADDGIPIRVIRAVGRVSLSYCL